MDTPVSLLERAACDAESQSWTRLTTIYAPLLRTWIGRYGLQSSDADDLVQEVLLHVTRALPEFRHNGRSGAFRAWLRTLMVHRLQKHWRSRDRNPSAAGGSDFLSRIQQLEDSASGVSRVWDREHDEHVARMLLSDIQGRFTATTWMAFQRTVMDGATTADVAQELQISPNAVCIAKSRVMQELRREARGLIE